MDYSVAHPVSRQLSQSLAGERGVLPSDPAQLQSASTSALLHTSLSDDDDVTGVKTGSRSSSTSGGHAGGSRTGSRAGSVTSGTASENERVTSGRSQSRGEGHSRKSSNGFKSSEGLKGKVTFAAVDIMDFYSREVRTNHCV